MQLTERWNMYSEIKRLKELGLKVSQIARHLDISRNTVYQYKDLEPDEYDQILENMQTRQKKLDHKKMKYYLSSRSSLIYQELRYLTG